jgi:hypothetical protein
MVGALTVAYLSGVARDQSGKHRSCVVQQEKLASAMLF